MAIGVLYHHPGTGVATFQTLNDIVSGLPDEQILLAGDIKLTKVKWHGDDTILPTGAVYAEFDDILTTYGLQPFV